MSLVSLFPLFGTCPFMRFALYPAGLLVMRPRFCTLCGFAVTSGTRRLHQRAPGHPAFAELCRDPPQSRYTRNGANRALPRLRYVTGRSVRLRLASNCAIDIHAIGAAALGNYSRLGRYLLVRVTFVSPVSSRFTRSRKSRRIFEFASVSAARCR